MLVRFKENRSIRNYSEDSHCCNNRVETPVCFMWNFLCTFPIDVRANCGRVCTGLAHHECICALTCAIACPLTLVKVTTLVVHKVLNVCNYLSCLVLKIQTYSSLSNSLPAVLTSASGILLNASNCVSLCLSSLIVWRSTVSACLRSRWG